MKKGIKIFILILLLGCASFEIWYLFFNKKEDKKESLSNPLEQEIVINNEDTKYIVDVEGKYKNNDLKYKEVKDGNYYYLQIDGLKNEDIQTKINNTIKERTKAITKDLYKEDLERLTNYYMYENIGSALVSSFSNTISIEIGYNFKPINYDTDLYLVLDTLNLDLNTGEELSINDIILTKEVLKQKLLDDAYRKIYISIGIVCQGGPCNNPEPHYERVEDGVMSIYNQFNKEDFKFSFDQKEITLYFSNSYINQPILVYSFDNLKVPEDKFGKPTILEDQEEKLYNDNYTKFYKDTISLGNVYDSVIIYNKFIKEESIFKTNNEKELYTFTKDEKESLYLYEQDNNLYYFIETDFYSSKETKMTDSDKLVINESKSLGDKKNKNLWIYKKDYYYTNYKYLYNYYILNHYSIPEDKYNEIRKKVYEARTKYLADSNELNNLIESLKEYKTKDYYFYYILDDNGKEYNTSDILNYNYKWDKVIPEKWLTGKYKTIPELLNSSFLLMDKNYVYKDRLVIYLELECNETFCTPKATLAYNNEKVEINDMEDEELNIYEMFKYE